MSRLIHASMPGKSYSKMAPKLMYEDQFRVAWSGPPLPILRYPTREGHGRRKRDISLLEIKARRQGKVIFSSQGLSAPIYDGTWKDYEHQQRVDLTQMGA